MKLLPYILTKQEKKEFTLWKFNVFLSFGGRCLWETDTGGPLPLSTIQEEYCISNGIFPDKIQMDAKKQIAYIHVNKEKTNLPDFYTWDEVYLKAEKPECWRSYYFIQDKHQTFWWSPKGLLEGELQGGENIQDLFEDCMCWSKDTSL